MTPEIFGKIRMMLDWDTRRLMEIAERQSNNPLRIVKALTNYEQGLHSPPDMDKQVVEFLRDKNVHVHTFAGWLYVWYEVPEFSTENSVRMPPSPAGNYDRNEDGSPRWPYTKANLDFIALLDEKLMEYDQAMKTIELRMLKEDNAPPPHEVFIYPDRTNSRLSFHLHMPHVPHITPEFASKVRQCLNLTPRGLGYFAERDENYMKLFERSDKYLHADEITLALERVGVSFISDKDGMHAYFNARPLWAAHVNKTQQSTSGEVNAC